MDRIKWWCFIKICFLQINIRFLKKKQQSWTNKLCDLLINTDITAHESIHIITSDTLENSYSKEVCTFMLRELKFIGKVPRMIFFFYKRSFKNCRRVEILLNLHSLTAGWNLIDFKVMHMNETLFAKKINYCLSKHNNAIRCLGERWSRF